MAAMVEPHELAQLFPPMEAEEFANLVIDIKKHGLADPIELYEGRVLDGVHRQNACREAKVAPRFVEWKNSDGPDTALAHVVSKNLMRRHLTPSQLAVIALDALPRFQAEAAERQKASGGGTGQRRSTLTGQKATAQAAAVFGVGEATIERAARVQREAPELIEPIRQGKVTVNAAAASLKAEEAAKRERRYSAEKERRQHEWETREVKSQLAAVAKFRDVLDAIASAAKHEKYAPEAARFMSRKLDALITHIKKTQEVLESWS